MGACSVRVAIFIRYIGSASLDADDQTVLLKLIQCRCLSLGIGLRKSGSLITDPEELLTLFNDLRVFIAIFPNKLYFHFQGFKIILQLLHLILECGIIQTDQV